MEKNTMFNQLMQIISKYRFNKLTEKYDGDRYVKSFTCWQQFMVLLYTQAKGLKSLRDIESSLLHQHNKWYHMGLTGIARSTLSDANNDRPFEIYEEMFYNFLSRCEALAPSHKFKISNPLYTIDSTTISLCLSAFPWAKYRKRKGALKIHALLDHKGCLPSFITITDGKCHDINVVKHKKFHFKQVLPDSIITVDRAYIDYKWLFSLENQGIFFITRSKSNINYEVTGQHEVKKNTGVLFDYDIKLNNYYQSKKYLKTLRLIGYYDKETDKELIFLTNNFKLAASTIAKLYKARWQIELFFKWIKQNLKIKTFLGTSKNAVMTQIWVAMIYYLLLSFIKFQSKYSYSLLELSRAIRELLLERVYLIEMLRLRYKHFNKMKEQSLQLTFW